MSVATPDRSVRQRGRVKSSRLFNAFAKLPEMERLDHLHTVCSADPHIPAAGRSAVGRPDVRSQRNGCSCKWTSRQFRRLTDAPAALRIRAVAQARSRRARRRGRPCDMTGSGPCSSAKVGLRHASMAIATQRSKAAVHGSAVHPGIVCSCSRCPSGCPADSTCSGSAPAVTNCEAGRQYG